MYDLDYSGDISKYINETVKQNKFMLIKDPPYVTPLYIIGYILQIIPCILGNSIELFILIRIKQPYDYITYAICTLAVSDLIQALVTMPLHLFRSIFDDWFLGYFLCKVTNYISFVNTLIGIWIIVYIAFDRYINICHPFRFESLKTTKFCIIVLSCICIGNSVVFLYGLVAMGMVVIKSQTLLICTMILPQKAVFLHRILVNVFYMFLIPMILLLYFYISVLRTRCSIISFRTLLSSVSEDVESSSSTKSLKNMLMDQILLFLTIFFFITSFPKFVFNVADAIHLVPLLPAPFLNLQLIGVFMLTMNSSANPWIYSFYSKRFRNELVNVLRCLTQKQAVSSWSHARLFLFQAEIPDAEFEDILD